MADKKITDLITIPSVDRTTNVLPIVDVSGNVTYKVTPNNLLGFTGGNPVSTSDSQTLTNKTLGNTNTITLKDTLFTLQDDGDTSKQAQFNLAGITTATTRIYSLPNVSDTLVSLTATQTLTNKTFTSPTINTPTITNASITADAVTGFSSANTGTIYGLAITSGAISGASITANTVPNTALQTGIQTSKFSNQYKFHYHNTTAETTGNGVFQKYTFNTADYDTGSNVSSSIFTAPVAGFYHFDAHYSGQTNTRTLINLYKNNAIYSRGGDVTAANPGVSVSDTIQLALNDTIQVFMFTGATSTQDVSDVGCAYFSGFLVSTT